jgi:hypothetical protein
VQSNNVGHVSCRECNTNVCLSHLRISDRLKFQNTDEKRFAIFNLHYYINALLIQGGIQQEYNESGAYVYKLFGHPFSSTTSQCDALQARIMCAELLSQLRHIGWQLLQSADLSRTQDYSTWFFQKDDALIPRVRHLLIETLSIMNRR